MTLTGPAAGTDFVKTSADPAGRTVARHAQQLLRRHHPVGHGADRRGELQPVLRAAEGRRPEPGRRPPDRYGIALEPRRASGSGSTTASTSPRSPTRRTGSAGSSNSTRTTRTRPRQAHRARPLQARGRRPCSDRRRPPRRLHRRRRAVRLHLQVRLEQADAARRQGRSGACAHNLTLLDEGTLYVAKLTGDSPPTRSTAPAGCRRTASSTAGHVDPAAATGRQAAAESHVDGMTAEEVAVFTRLAGDKVGATKMDRPEDVEANPKTGKVYVALTNNSDRGARRRGPGRRGQPAQRQQARSDPRDHRARNHAGHRLHLVRCCWWRRPAGRRHLLRRLRQGQGQPDLLPGQRRLRQPRQPVDLHRRQRPRLARRPVRCRTRRRATAVSPSSS